MFKLDEKVLNVAGHTDATPASCVVPFDVNTRKFVASHVELDPVELLENITEMVEVFELNILQPKVINNEIELDGMQFVVPEAWGGFGFVISFSKKAGSEEIGAFPKLILFVMHKHLFMMCVCDAQISDLKTNFVVVKRKHIINL